MKNLSIFLLSYALAFNILAVNSEPAPVVEVLERLVQGAVYQPLGLYRDPKGALPKPVQFAKGALSMPQYPNGIYLFIVAPEQNEKYYFDRLDFLKKDTTILHIVIVGNAANAEFFLPRMDTIVNGTQIKDSKFYLGLGAPSNQNKRYFFLAGDNEFEN